MASIIQKKRLTNEVKLLAQQPLHYCTAYPDETNPLIWYFLIKGQRGTDYHTGQEGGGGEYIGKIVHSPKYPAEPPDYYMLTPSGRYNVGSKICLTNSSYHKGDWSSTWNILSILIAFYSIWLDDKEHGISHITDSAINRKRMASESIGYNLKNNSAIYSKFDKTNLRDDAPVILKKKVVAETESSSSSSSQVQPAEPAEPVQPIQQVQQVQPVQPVQPAEPIQPIQPVQQVQPAEPIQQIKETKKTKQNKPIMEIIADKPNDILNDDDEDVKERKVKKTTKKTANK
jgi:ubiquitin-conjugating enzyme E2 J2